MKLPTLYGLPVSYTDSSYTSTSLSKTQQAKIQASIAAAPKAGLLVIQGTAAPIVAQLQDIGRQVRGIDFSKRTMAAFEQHMNPPADVIIIYNIGFEITMNSNVSKKVLASLIKHYQEQRSLIILETRLTKAEMLSTYDMSITNFIKILPKDDDTWV